MSSRILRMRDLKERGIVGSWPMLKRKIERDGFPVGILLGPNSRGWLESEVDAWIASRPTGDNITPRGIALRKMHQARAEARRRASAEATISEKNPSLS